LDHIEARGERYWGEEEGLELGFEFAEAVR